MSEEVNAFGEMPRDFAMWNKGVNPEFFLEKQIDGTFLECVRISVAGDTLNECVKPVDDEVKARFETEYARWKKTTDTVDPRTALEAWGPLTKKQCAELVKFNVNTVEDLAALSDAHLHILPDGRRMRDRAAAFLENGGDSKTLRELTADNKSLRDELASLRALVTAKKGKI
jgi:hypothetical protein